MEATFTSVSECLLSTHCGHQTRCFNLLAMFTRNPGYSRGGHSIGCAPIAMTTCLWTALATAYSLTYGYGAAHRGSDKIWPDIPLTYFIMLTVFFGLSFIVLHLAFRPMRVFGSWAICTSAGLVLFVFQLVGRTWLRPSDIATVTSYACSGFFIGFVVAIPAVAIDFAMRKWIVSTGPPCLDGDAHHQHD